MRIYPRSAGFLFLLAVITVGFAAPVDKGQQENDIREAVFRYQFEHNVSGQKGHAHEYYLSITEVGSSFGRDLPGSFMKRFVGHRPPVRKFSDCRITSDGRVVSKHSGRTGLLFMTGRITWLSDTTVTVNGGYYEGNVGSSGSPYTVANEAGAWRVVKDQMTVISQSVAPLLPQR
jgi:hypothetical protein